MDNGERIQLFEALRNLPPQDFERLLFVLKPPGGLIPSPEAPQMNRVKALLDWAEGSSGRGIDEVQDCFNKLQNGTLLAPFDFSIYLQTVCEDPRYQSVRDFYTETEVLIPLEAETVEQASPTADGRREAKQPQQKIEPFPVLEGLRKYALGENHQHLLLAGRPGSGKSTTLKRLLLELAEAAPDQPELVPVYVQLKGDRPIIDLIIAEFRRTKVRVTSDQLDEWLLQDRLLLLLDGVNEIPSDEQRRKLQAFREDNPTAPMIFTTRDLAVGGDLGIEKRLEMRPLNDAQMREFVQRYLRIHADTLLRQLKDRLREVAETPLLLKMFCDVFDPATEQIPQSKGELFRLFDSKYDEFKGLAATSDDFRRFKPELLRHLAFGMLQGDPTKPTEAWLTMGRDRAEQMLETLLTGRVEAPGQRAKEWVEDLLEHHLLQLATDPKEIEFHHQLFQEYYAAEDLLLRLPELLKDEESFKQDYLNYLKWTEPISLMLALVDDEAQALRVVKLAIDDVDLMLGARLAGESKSIVQTQTLGYLNFLQISKLLTIELLSSMRSDVALPDLKNELADGNLDIFREAAVKALIKIGNQEAMSCLLKILTDEDEGLFELAAHGLAKYGSEEAVNYLLKFLSHENSYFRQTSASALGEISCESVVLSLCKVLDDGEVHLYASLSLAKLNSQIELPPSCIDLANNILLKYKELQNVDSYISHKEIQESKQTGRELKDSMLNKLLNGNARVYELVDLAGRLINTYGDDVISIFLELLSHDKFAIRFAVARALAEGDHKESIPILLEGIARRDSFSYSTASIAIKRIGSPELLLPLYKLISTGEGFRLFHFRHILDSIIAIQNRCQFYNHEVRQQSIQNTKLESQKTEQAEVAKQSTNIFPNATEVRIFERVERYYENPPSTPDQPS